MFFSQKKKVCEDNTYGPNCVKKCSPYCAGANNSCDRFDGSCVYGCIDGYFGDFCEYGKDYVSDDARIYIFVIMVRIIKAK